MKKNMKQLAALALAFLAGISALAGCGKSSENKENTNAAVSTDTPGSSKTEPAAGGDGEEPYEIVMSYVTLGSNPTDLIKVQDELSKLTKEKINCTVKFKPVAITDLASQYNLWASSGEQVDLLMMFAMDISPYVNEGKILALDEYLDKAPAVKAIEEERGFLAGGMYNNQLYAIPVCNPSVGEGKAMYARKDLLDAVGFEQKDLYSYEELDALFAKLKAANPDMTTLCWAGVRNNTVANYFIPCYEVTSCQVLISRNHSFSLFFIVPMPGAHG